MSTDTTDHTRDFAPIKHPVSTYAILGPSYDQMVGVGIDLDLPKVWMPSLRMGVQYSPGFKLSPFFAARAYLQDFTKRGGLFVEIHGSYMKNCDIGKELRLGFKSYRQSDDTWYVFEPFFGVRSQGIEVCSPTLGITSKWYPDDGIRSPRITAPMVFQRLSQVHENPGDTPKDRCKHIGPNGSGI